jgi:hypothetical protein
MWATVKAFFYVGKLLTPDDPFLAAQIFLLQKKTSARPKGWNSTVAICTGIHHENANQRIQGLYL